MRTLSACNGTLEVLGRLARANHLSSSFVANYSILGEEFFFKKRQMGKSFSKKINFFRSATLGKFFFLKRANVADGVNSSPSATMALGEDFPGCAIFRLSGKASSP
jgi:hypothetical protein